MTAAALTQLPDSKWEFGFATIGVFVVVMSALFTAIMLVKVIAEIVITLAERRRDRRLEAQWHVEEARLEADKATADLADDDERWALITDATRPAALPNDHLPPFRPQIIYGIDHGPHREHG